MGRRRRIVSTPGHGLVALVVMGVSGSGKTTLGRALAERLGRPFVEGDDLHPAANLAKMKAGVPLTDQDRAPWLAVIADRIEDWRRAGTSGVVACSALKRDYRTRLVGDGHDVRLIYLTGDEAVLAQRMAHRPGHFMPPSLLASQLNTLEAPTSEEAAITLDIDRSLEAQVEAVLAALRPGVHGT